MSRDSELAKAAAHRMCEHLATRGVRVRHTLMLEALAAGLGAANWRTLRAALDAPRFAPEPGRARVCAPGVFQAWSVEGIYDDNDQQWGEDVSARTAREAAAMAKMERLTDLGLVIDVTSVRDAAGNCVLSPDFFRRELQFDSPRRALQTVLEAAARVRGAGSKRQRAAVAWLRSCLQALAGEDELFELTDFDAWRRASARRRPATLVCDDETFRASEALAWICDLLEADAGGVVALEKSNEAFAFILHQVRAMAFYFAAALDDCEHGLASRMAQPPFLEGASGQAPCASAR